MSTLQLQENDFDISEEEDMLALVEFLEGFIDNPNLYESLNINEKLLFHNKHREAYLRNNSKERELAKKLNDKIDNIVTINYVYSYSIYPSKTHNRVCIIDEKKYLNIIKKASKITYWLTEKKSEHFDVYKFYANTQSATKFYILFINPLDLSYHNFENIIDINDKFEPINLTPKTLFVSKNYIKFEIDSCPCLKNLDIKQFYSDPVNSSQRGGSRFIFRSQDLAQNIENIIRYLNVPYLTKDLVCVNDVFRYNKFRPTDKNFANHYDIPYSDRQNCLYSVYTLIIYITAPLNKLDIPLSIENNDVHINNDYTCVLFNQKLKHTGNIYNENDKIFIRTELIYKIDESLLDNDKSIAKIFNSACYMTIQSSVIPNTTNNSSRLFELVADYKNNGVNEVFNLPLIAKKFGKSPQKLGYVTNGSDYFFLANENKYLIALIILLDYYNASVTTNYYGDNLSYNSVVKPQDLKINPDKISPEYIKMIISSCFKNMIDPLLIVHEASQEYAKNFIDLGFSIYRYSETDDFENTEICKKYLYDVQGIDFNSLSLVISGEKYIINLNQDITITENQIIYGVKRMKSINFASCQCVRGEMIDVEETIGLLIPPVDYEIKDGIFVANVDIFNNATSHNYLNYYCDERPCYCLSNWQSVFDDMDFIINYYYSHGEDQTFSKLQLNEINVTEKYVRSDFTHNPFLSFDEQKYIFHSNLNLYENFIYENGFTIDNIKDFVKTPLNKLDITKKRTILINKIIFNRTPKQELFLDLFNLMRISSTKPTKSARNIY